MPLVVAVKSDSFDAEQVNGGAIVVTEDAASKVIEQRLPVIQMPCSDLCANRMSSCINLPSGVVLWAPPMVSWGHRTHPF